MKKVLVANRGEIALRVFRSLKKMGIRSVAIFSEADRNAPHVLFADEAFCVGPPPSSESYLRQDEIINIAVANAVDGIHPGYGFLSENAEFAQKVTDAGMEFIGPSPHSIRIMGSKLAAKEAVKKFEIPMVPGTDKPIEDISVAKSLAKQIGFPILIKAAAGGGGKGMRIVKDINNFEEQLQMATSEAKSSFGDGAVFIERYVESPKHIEIQILGDKHGNYIHLFERECSIQRRHQKVVEEAPSAVLSEALREQMGQAAIDVARSCAYYGVGTVEFLLDSENRFYFLEMNTRLQVEHPVTEFITGVDLVEEQIKVAQGDILSIHQSELVINGHAIELRIYAEDPRNEFAPSIGTLSTYKPPASKNGVRVDDGYREGMEVPIYYDPMISKLIVHAHDRNTAIEKMKQAILDYQIEGIKNTLEFGQFVMQHSSFLSGQYNTHFVQDYFSIETLNAPYEKINTIAALLTDVLFERYDKSLQIAENSAYLSES